jgi:uncharacterized protein (DUF2147 family)
MKRLQFILSVFLLLLFADTATTLAQKNPDEICGRWLTADGDGVIVIYKCGEFYCGKIAGGSTGNDSLDSKNPKPELRKRKLLGLDILTGLKFKGENDWGDGKIYDPEGGGEYNMFVNLENKNTLNVRGYMGLSILGRTEQWTRINK